MAAESESRIAENVVLFCRTLRKAGLSIGPGQVIDACGAIVHTGIERRHDFQAALRAVLVKDPSQFVVFDQAFHVYFRNPRLLERMMGLLLPTLEQPGGPDDGDAAIRRLHEALSGGSEREHQDDVVIEIDQAGSSSDRELLRQKDFEAMSIDELRDAQSMLRNSMAFLRQIPTRRFRSDPQGRRYDMRRSMQLMARNGGHLVALAHKSRRARPPTLVLICDISGSMSRYSRMFLHFAHALCASRLPVHAFVFGTRLTNITHWLADRDVDRALAQVSAEVRDWDGGTRIGECLRRFNVDWGRRVLSGRSVVVLLSDGLERDTSGDLDFQAARLHRSTDEFIWLNPMLRFDGFEPLAFGIRTILPHVDRFLPAHNVDSLAELGSLLMRSRHRTGRHAA